MGFGFGFRFGLGSGGGGASPPTVLTLILPAVSDETVDCTATFSPDAEEWTVVPHGDPAPVHGVGTWTPVGDTRVHTTALSGAIELDAYGWSAAGGVSVTPASSVVGCVVPGLITWLEPARGMTVVEARVALDATWSGIGLDNWPASLPDVVADASAGNHRIFAPSTPAIAVGPMRWSVDVSEIGGADVLSVTDQAYAVASTNGTDFMTWSGAPAMVVTRTGSGPVWHIQADIPIWNGLTNNNMWSVAAGAGQSGKGVRLEALTVWQHRCSALPDQFGTNDFAQASAGSQLFIRKADGSSPGGAGIDGGADIWQPNDSVKTIVNSGSALASLFNSGTFTLIARQCWLGQYGAYTGFVGAYAGTKSFDLGYSSGGGWYCRVGSSYAYATLNVTQGVTATLALSMSGWTSSFFRDGAAAGSDVHTDVSDVAATRISQVISAGSVFIFSAQALSQAQIQAIGAAL